LDTPQIGGWKIEVLDGMEWDGMVPSCSIPVHLFFAHPNNGT